MFSLRLLGGLAVEGSAGALGGRAAQKRRLALLALLARAPAGQISRDKVIGFLWPETDESRARHLLSVAVYEIRKALGEAALLSVGDDLGLSPEHVRSDVAVFLERLERGETAGAVEAYGGPFLDGFFLSDAPEFERWAEAERDRLARLYRQALEALAAEREARGDGRGALEAWRRLAAEDRFSARVALGLMRALEAAGDRAAAIQHARAHAALLREELGAEPDPEVAALAERLRGPAAAQGPHGQEAGAPGAPPTGAHPADDHPGPDAAAVLPPTTADRPVALRPPARRSSIRRRLAAALAVLGLALGAWGVWKGREAPPPATAIAVLPFVDVSPDGGSEHFSDGITEEILNALAPVEGLAVASRTSVFAFKGARLDVREIGRQLDVGSVLEGSVRRAGDRVRITARLVDVASGYRLWSETFDRRLEDIFAIQEEIARAIVQALSVELGGERALVRGTTADLEAYDLYLKGRFAWFRRNAEGLGEAVSYFERAVERDPAYALAHAGLADAFNTLGAHDYGLLPPREAFSRAIVAAERALALDPGLAEAHAALGLARMNFDWDWAGAERSLRRALELSPGYASAHHWYSLLLNATGRPQEALAEVRRARELDPSSPVLITSFARYYYFTRQYQRAAEEYRSALALDAGSVTARLGLGLALVQLGEHEQAIEEYRAALDLMPAPRPIVLGLLGHAYGLAGRSGQAREILARLGRLSEERYVPPEYVTLVHLGLGETDRAMTWLEKAYEDRSGAMVYLRVEPLLDPLRPDPRFERLMARVGR